MPKAVEADIAAERPGDRGDGRVLLNGVAVGTGVLHKVPRVVGLAEEWPA